MRMRGQDEGHVSQSVPSDMVFADQRRGMRDKKKFLLEKRVASDPLRKCAIENYCDIEAVFTNTTG